MAGAGKPDGDRLVAAAVVIVLHLLFWRVLQRTVTTPTAATPAAEALQVHWVAPPVPSPRPPTAAPSPVPGTRATAPRKPAASPRHGPMTGPGTGREPSPRRGLSAVFIEQALAASAERAGELFTRDPFADRRANLPGVEADTFRMREPPSLQGALRAVGKLFGGPGYTTDPCPRIRENLNDLSQDGDNALLQEELRRKRAYCD